MTSKLSRLRELITVQKPHSFVLIESDLVCDLLDLVEAVKKVEMVLRAEHGHRVAEVNFGYLFAALSKLEAPND